MAKKIFEEFTPASTQQWEEVIQKDLKGADYNKRLVTKTIEGLEIKPYYRKENLENLPYLQDKPGDFPFVRGTREEVKPWLVRQTITVKDVQKANLQARELLKKGVEMLSFAITQKITASDLEQLLQGIDITKTVFNFEGTATCEVARLFIDKVTKSNYDVEEVRAFFGIDPVLHHPERGSEMICKDKTSCFDHIKELIIASGKYKRMRFVTVNGQQIHNAGVSAVQELAFAMSAGYEYVVQLLERGLTIDQVAPYMTFNFGVGSNYFMEIAKFRAARILWANIIQPYQPQRGCSTRIVSNAITSTWNLTVYDAYVNMLRATTEAMSAALSGVFSIDVVPFDTHYEEPTELALRMARNTQIILKEEAHLDKVTDPSAGSYYIETLTFSIAHEAWKLFKTVEEKGGFLKAYESGFITAEIQRTAQQRAANLSNRKDILLGTNQFPNFDEQLSKTAIEKLHSSTATAAIPAQRGSQPFDDLRMKTECSGKTPTVFMLTYGNLAMCRARAQFACNFFAIAGFKVVDNNCFATIEEGIAAAKNAKAQIVVACSSDEEYAQTVPQIAKALSGVITVVAGEPECKSILEQQGVTHFISVKSNLLTTLSQYQKELGI